MAGLPGVVWGDQADYEHEWDAVGLSRDELYVEIHGLSSVEMHPEWYATDLVEMQPLEKYRVWIRFIDGTERNGRDSGLWRLSHGRACSTSGRIPGLSHNVYYVKLAIFMGRLEILIIYCIVYSIPHRPVSP